MKSQSLRSRIIAVLLVVSLLPLCIVGVGAWIVFGRLLEQKSLEVQRTVVESHSRAIESYLTERLNSLRLLASSHSLAEITDFSTLQNLLSNLNKTSNEGFIDLGVIASDGEHLAYVGPYDLLDRNYYDTAWFIEVMDEGSYISDIFLGFRQVPHCIIAVRKEEDSDQWILRATINSDQFNDIVRTSMLGETGNVFIVNRSGLYQTAPKNGSVLDASPMTGLDYYPGVRDQKVKVNGSTKIQVTTWINNDNWLLVAEQDAAEVRAPVTNAIAKGAIIVLMAIVLLVVTTFLATRHLTDQIDRANERREEMYRAFMRSAKLASIGELATGLAHEINNPLAVISADQTNISDIVEEMPEDAENRAELIESLDRIKRQVLRCRSITTKMLQFGRKSETEPKFIDITTSLKEIIALLERQANVRNVKMLLETEENLPEIWVDPVELEQVIVNLINNSLQAMPRGGEIHIIVRHQDNELLLEVSDNGLGIPPESLDRIFEPFFTTKPVGKGTGLGLSVCYGIVQTWGGKIEVESQVGHGTTIYIHIPTADYENSRIDR